MGGCPVPITEHNVETPQYIKGWVNYDTKRDRDLVKVLSQPHLHQSEVVNLLHESRWRSWCIVCYTKLLYIFLVEYISCEFLWRLLQTLSHSHGVIFCPEWPSPAAATCHGILYTSRLPEFVWEVLCWESGSSISAWKAMALVRWMHLSGLPCRSFLLKLTAIFC